ncbi:hypothetical protein FM106_14525 [Brachybacterium faecium]|nr:hypothetical protein FM106_14525 [Brachybacterium faecium]
MFNKYRIIYTPFLKFNLTLLFTTIYCHCILTLTKVLQLT